MKQEEAEDIHHEHRRGGGAPTRGAYTLVTRRIASKNIYRRERRKKNKRKNRGREREPSRPARRDAAVLIWPSERDDTASRHEATRRRASILERFRASKRATLFRA